MSNITSTQSVQFASQAENLLDGYVLKRVEYCVNRLAKKLSFDSSKKDDARQSLIFGLLSAWRRFDPAQSQWHTFACRVLNVAVRKIAENHRRLRRRENVSSVYEETFAGIEENIPSKHDDLASVELESDVAGVIASLPKHLRAVAEALKDHSPEDAARLLGIGRSSIYRHIKELRRHFSKAGFFLQIRGTNFRPNGM